MIHLLIIAVYYSLEILTFFFIDNLILFAYLFFNWRRIALQHWVGFFRTTAGAAVTICILPPSGPPGLPSVLYILRQFIVCSNTACRNMDVSIRFIKVAPGFIFPKEKHFAVVFVVVCYFILRWNHIIYLSLKQFWCKLKDWTQNFILVAIIF